MVGEISYSQYSELYDEGTKQIQKAYELGKADLEKENTELKEKYVKECEDVAYVVTNYNKQLTKAKELIRTLLLIADNKISQMEFQLCVADAKQFLKENE